MARPIAKDHEEKRAAILKSAARLFADEGYGRASMAQVALVCGISKANIYHYYPGKEALLFDILDTHLSGLRDRICRLQFASDDPGAQLQTILTELLLAYQGADAEHGVQLNALSALPSDQQKALKRYQLDLVDVVETRIKRLVPAAIASDAGTCRSLTMSAFAMVNWHYQWNASASEEARRDYARLITRLMLSGLPGLDT